MKSDSTIIKNKSSDLAKIVYQYKSVYFLTITTAFIMRYFCRQTDSDMLKWILTPTARWVSIMSGINFEYVPHKGYVNHFYQFLIAPSCSGNRFMLLTFLMLIFSFTHRTADTNKSQLWFVLSLPISYISTIIVNGLRITASILIPQLSEKLPFISSHISPDTLHTIIGCSIYFSGLYIIYLSVGAAFKRINTLIPLLWYLSLVLAFPFIKRIYYNEWYGFGRYALVIIFICMCISLIINLFKLIAKRPDTP